MNYHKPKLFFWLFALGVIGNFLPTVYGQTERGVQLKPKFDLAVTKGTKLTVTLHAEGAPLVEIVKQLTQKIGVPITLSAKLRAERVTAKFSDAPLETALAELAPQSYADYVVNGGWNTQPQCVGIFLQARTEKQPASDVNIKPRAQAFLLEGDTETGGTETVQQTKEGEEPPLKISITQGLLSVRARQQPLTVVMYKIADSYGLPFEMRAETTDLIDQNLQAVTPLELLRTLPAGAQLYYRRNLQNSLDKPLRLLLEKPVLEPKRTLREQKSLSRHH